MTAELTARMVAPQVEPCLTPWLDGPPRCKCGRMYRGSTCVVRVRQAMGVGPFGGRIVLAYEPAQYEEHPYEPLDPARWHHNVTHHPERLEA